MERRTKKLIKLSVIGILRLLVLLTLVVSLVKFCNADEVMDKIEYGVTMLAMMILMFRE